MLGLYIHIPFCHSKCRYCDFPSYAHMETFFSDYVDALCCEISTSHQKGQRVDTIYFGGGTPSLLSIEQLNRIMTALTKTFTLSTDSEITIEGNPESLYPAYMRSLVAIGFNRISIGIQSFQPALLQKLGRIHSSEEAVHAVTEAYDAGFANISADLMYGLPGQTVAHVQDDVHRLIALPVSHASIYSLIVEEGTWLYRDVEKGFLSLPKDQDVEAMADCVHSIMSDAGFEHYEISSYALPGKRSRHNSKYWTYEDYLGFGASAHSFYGGERYANIHTIPGYIQKAGHESLHQERVTIDEKRGQEDFCFLALRMIDGIEYEAFQKRFGVTIESQFGPVINHLMEQGFLEKTARGCKLTARGLSYGNYVFSQFIR